MTDQLPTETVKLSRTDAVALVAQQIADDAAGDVAKCERAVIAARTEFQDCVAGDALEEHCDLLERVASALHVDNVGLLNAQVIYRVYEDGENSGSVAQVVFADHPQTYEARGRLAVSVNLSPGASELRDAWAAALADLKNARERDLRVGAMKREARDALIKAALNESSEGQAVVDSIRALSAAMRGKVS